MQFEAIPRPRKDMFKNQHLVQLNSPRAELKNVEYPEDGYDILIHYKGLAYPKSGFPTPEAVLVIGSIKRLVVVTAKTVRDLLPIPTPKKFKHVLCENIIYQFCYRQIQTFIIHDTRLTRPVREIRRAGYKIFGHVGIKHEHGETTGECAVDIFAMALEYDDAYRDRFQDIIPEIDISALKKNHRKEMKRIVDNLVNREEESIGSMDRYMPLLKLANILMYIPSVKRAAIAFLKELDMTQIDFNDQEFYWALHRGDYNVKGLNKNERGKMSVKWETQVKILNDATLEQLAI